MHRPPTPKRTSLGTRWAPANRTPRNVAVIAMTTIFAECTNSKSSVCRNAERNGYAYDSHHRDGTATRRDTR